MFVKIQRQLSSRLNRSVSSEAVRTATAALVILLSILVGSGVAWGQDNPDFEMGVKSFGVYNFGNLDTTNIANGQTTVYVPLISYKQRGAHPPLEFGLMYFNNGFWADWTCQAVGGFVFQGILSPPVGAICTGSISSPVPTGFNHGFQLVTKGTFTKGGLGGTCVGSSPNQSGVYQLYTCTSAVTEWDGATHQLAPINSTTWLSVDGSGYRLDMPQGVLNTQTPLGQPTANATLTDPNGIRTWLDPTSTLTDSRLFREDANGNRITYESFNVGYGAGTGYTDTMGRFLPDYNTAYVNAATNYLDQGTPEGNGIPVDTSGCTGPHPTSFAFTWTVPGPNGGSYPFKFCFSDATEQVPSIPVPTGPVQMAPVKTSNLQSIVLPNGTAWTFQYSGDNFNDLAQVTLPTGGTLSYTWTSPPAYAPPNSGPQFIVTRGAATRTLDPHDGVTPPAKTSYNYAPANQLPTVVVTDPAGNDSVHTFTAYGGSPYETQVKTYQGPSSGGNVLRTINKEYLTVNGPPLTWTDTMAIALSAETTTLENGLQKRVEYDYDSNQISFVSTLGGGGFRWQTLYNADGTFFEPPNTTLPAFNARYKKLFATRQYDYGTGRPGPLLRQEVTAYAFEAAGGQGPCPYYLTAKYPYYLAYQGNNLLNLVGATQVQDGSCNVVAQSTLGYDEANLQPSGISMQLNSSPPAGVLRGNLTSVTQVNTGNSVTTQTNWYDTGEVFQKIDALGNATTISYAPAYFGAYPTKTCNALNQCNSGTYDLTSGLLTSFTDANGQITQYTYDNMERIAQITWPAQVVNGSAIEGKTTYTYNDTPGSLSVQRTAQQDGSTSIVNTSFIDGLGRVTGTQLNDPEGNVLTKTTYDIMGRTSTVANPYRTTSDTTYGVTHTQYDALGRVTSVTHPDGSTMNTAYNGRASQISDEGNGTGRITRITQTDGLGRLTSVCEVTTATQANQSSPSACGQDIAATGFLTNYQYDGLGNLTGVSQSGMNRSFTYDKLSRLLSTTNPESGTTSYTYDGNGNMLTRVRPAPNQSSTSVTVTTSYAYDKLNRLTGVTYSDGITSSVSKHYDTTSELGVTLNNTVGRLTAEYVNSPSGQMMSARIFSYDAMGRVIDNSQCTPQNCSSSTPLSITYSYDLLGKPLTATNGQGVTFGYSYDSAGRLTGMSSNLVDAQHPGTLFSNATYSALGSLTQGSMGSILSEALAYDCRGRLVSYGSAVLPATATAPSVTNTGCPVSVATRTQDLSGAEFLNASLGTGGRFENFLGSHRAPNIPWFTATGFAASQSLTAFGNDRSPSQHSDSILFSRAGQSNNQDHGSVTVTLRSETSAGAPRRVETAYSPKDTPQAIARKLAKQFNRSRDQAVNAKVQRSESGAILEFRDRRNRSAGFELSVSVHTDMDLPSIRAVVQNKQSRLPMLTGMTKGVGR